MAINNLITFRKGIATEWSSQNPTLSSGEPGYDGTNNILKIGDGDTAWNSLNAVNQLASEGSPYLGGELNLDNNDLVIDCRNDTGSEIAAGTPVYVSGYYSANGKPSIAPADASDSNKMPAFGILNAAIANDTEGTMGIMGVVSRVNTSSYNVGDVIYVASGGGLTNTKPILENNLIQNLGRVLRVDASKGRILLLGAGRTNDVPNLDEGKIWVGSSTNTTTSSTVHLDETNNRVGIGTITPAYELDVNGTINSAKLEITNTSTDDSLLITTTEDSSTAAPVLTFKRNSSSPVDGDYLGQLKFKGENDADQEVVYAKVTAKISDVTDTTEDGLFEFALRKAGSNNIGMRLTSTSLNLLNGTEMDMGSQQIHSVLDPTSAQDAATKNYVDSNHITISAASSVDNSNGNVIQDITLDSNGHVTALGSIDLDTRYYTESEIDAFNYVDGNGTASYLPKWSDTDTLTNSVVYDDGTNIGIGTASPGYKLDVNGTFSANSINVNDAFTFPTTDGSADQYLKTDGLGNVTWSTIAGGGGGISNVVEDTTPQLGGTLDLNGNNIEGYAFETTPTGTIIGASGWIYQSGQQVLSNGSFGTHIGDAQFTQNVLRAQTTDATLTNLTIGTQSGILLASNRTYNFTVNIVGRRTNGQDHAGYKLEGMLVNDGYGTQILGSPVKTTFYESDTSWDAQVAITGAGAGGTDYLLVRCQGATSKNVNWVAHADMLEVGGNIDGYTEANILGVGSNIVP